MMKECSMEANKAACNCSYPCAKKGLCCECVAYHRKAGELPACYFGAAAERTYDRSIEHYLRTRKA
jgi:hypothetical protein